MRETRTLPFIFAELGEGVGCVQNQHHVHDVFNHNLAALEACASHGGDLVDRFSALLHDVGKPRTAAPRPDGNGNTFYGHDDLGAVMVKDILGRLRYGNELIGDVSSLVGLHMYATCGSDGTAVSDASVRRFIQNCTRGTDDRALARARVERQFLLRACDRIGSGRDLSVRQGENDAFEDRVRAEMAKNVPVTTAALVVDGRDIIAAAIAAGVRKTGYRGDRLVGETLDQPKLNERSRLLAAADEILAQQRPDIQNTLTP
jgi:putative nucleotidyltransferase with HDIG domain